MYSSKKVLLILSFLLASGLIIYAAFFQITGTDIVIYSALGAAIVLWSGKKNKCRLNNS